MFNKRFSKASADAVTMFLRDHLRPSPGKYVVVDDILRAFVRVTGNVRLEYHNFVKIMKHLKPREFYRNKSHYVVIDYEVDNSVSRFVSADIVQPNGMQTDVQPVQSEDRDGDILSYKKGSDDAPIQTEAEERQSYNNENNQQECYGV